MNSWRKNVGVIKSRRVRWEGHEASMGRGTYIQDFGGETWRKVLTWKTKTLIGS